MNDHSYLRQGNTSILINQSAIQKHDWINLQIYLALNLKMLPETLMTSIFRVSNSE